MNLIRAALQPKNELNLIKFRQPAAVSKVSPKVFKGVWIYVQRSFFHLGIIT